eukprot:2805483-Rhodomonas_salina.2
MFECVGVDSESLPADPLLTTCTRGPTLPCETERTPAAASSLLTLIKGLVAVEPVSVAANTMNASTKTLGS